MAQWVNHLRNNIFINLLSLLWLSEISGALQLALSGLMAGRWQAGRRNVEIFKTHCRRKDLTFRFF